MISFTEFRKRRLLDAIQTAPVLEGIDHYFDILRLDMLEAVQIPLTITESYEGEVAEALNWIIDFDNERHREIVEEHVARWKADFNQMLIEDARLDAALANVPTNIDALGDAGEKLKKKIAWAIDQLFNTFKTEIMGAMVGANSPGQSPTQQGGGGSGGQAPTPGQASTPTPSPSPTPVPSPPQSPTSGGPAPSPAPAPAPGAPAPAPGTPKPPWWKAKSQNWGPLNGLMNLGKSAVRGVGRWVKNAWQGNYLDHTISEVVRIMESLYEEADVDVATQLDILKQKLSQYITLYVDEYLSSLAAGGGSPSSSPSGSAPAPAPSGGAQKPQTVMTQPRTPPGVTPPGQPAARTPGQTPGTPPGQPAAQTAAAGAAKAAPPAPAATGQGGLPWFWTKLKTGDYIDHQTLKRMKGSIKNHQAELTPDVLEDHLKLYNLHRKEQNLQALPQMPKFYLDDKEVDKLTKYAVSQEDLTNFLKGLPSKALKRILRSLDMDESIGDTAAHAATTLAPVLMRPGAIAKLNQRAAATGGQAPGATPNPAQPAPGAAPTPAAPKPAPAPQPAATQQAPAASPAPAAPKPAPAPQPAATQQAPGAAPAASSGTPSMAERMASFKAQQAAQKSGGAPSSQQPASPAPSTAPKPAPAAQPAAPAPSQPSTPGDDQFRTAGQNALARLMLKLDKLDKNGMPRVGEVQISLDDAIALAKKYNITDEKMLTNGIGEELFAPRYAQLMGLPDAGAALEEMGKYVKSASGQPAPSPQSSAASTPPPPESKPAPAPETPPAEPAPEAKPETQPQATPSGDAEAIADDIMKELILNPKVGSGFQRDVDKNRAEIIKSWQGINPFTKQPWTPEEFKKHTLNKYMAVYPVRNKMPVEVSNLLTNDELYDIIREAQSKGLDMNDTQHVVDVIARATVKKK